MASAKDSDTAKRVLLGLLITLVLSSFGFTFIIAGSLETKKLDKTVYEEHKEAQNKAFEIVSDGFKEQKQRDEKFEGMIQAIITRESDGFKEQKQRDEKLEGMIQAIITREIDTLKAVQPK
jgi:hypothetical protein